MKRLINRTAHMQLEVESALIKGKEEIRGADRGLVRHKKIRSDDYITTDNNCALKSIGDRTGEAGVVEATASHKSGVKVGGTGDQKRNHSLSSM
ncbi:hypothetical protein YC2023_015695 [Brassica napus]